MPSYISYKNNLIATLDANNDNIESWITVNGNHIPIMKGQSKEEAVKNFLAKKSDKESSVRSNKPESVGTAAKRVVKQTEENRKTYKEATNTRKLENGGFTKEEPDDMDARKKSIAWEIGVSVDPKQIPDASVAILENIYGYTSKELYDDLTKSGMHQDTAARFASVAFPFEPDKDVLKKLVKHPKWNRVKHRLDYHGINEFILMDIVDSGKYGINDIIDALQSSSHAKINKMRKAVKK